MSCIFSLLLKVKYYVFILLQVKGAFTRCYNKEVHLTPYGTSTTTKRSSRLPATEDYGDGEDGEEGGGVEEEGEGDEGDMSQDPMVKPAKRETAASRKKQKGSSSSSSSSSKGGVAGKGSVAGHSQKGGGKKRSK